MTKLFGEANPPLTENLVSYILSMTGSTTLRLAEQVNRTWRDAVFKMKLRTKIFESTLKKCDFFTRITFQDFDFAPLSGGLTNSTFKLVIQGQAYVARIPGRETRLFIDRSAEYWNAAIAMKYGINTVITYFDPANGSQVTAYLQDPVPMTSSLIKEPLYLEAAINTLRRIHQSTELFKNDVDIFSRNRIMLDIISHHGNALLSRYQELAKTMEDVEKLFSVLTLPKRPCHNDTTPSNFVCSNGKMYLIDWEYSGNNLPIWDLVCLAVEAGFSREDTQRMLALYYGPEAPENDRLFQILIPVYEFWVALWAGVQIANANHSGDEKDLLALEKLRLDGCSSSLKTLTFKESLASFRKTTENDSERGTDPTGLLSVGMFSSSPFNASAQSSTPLIPQHRMHM
ncbi:hypothetical protein AQUSIP_23300 [Aquicella siphonis]|uniref:Aminoglycoside phosphotransferase domain-containing protein n=1 Tax=Aquicella siphonis TaxID=254247 RepID=A0A5E4PL01_9COXI|nr:choline/ethanolamine kinase family protein [Aquicella siphonis]VVC77003.1 hypothetical protein AQUSIP_23300 [Aquicella siphonis]